MIGYNYKNTMKNLITLLIVLLSISGYSQEDPNKKYPMYSDIWRINFETHQFLPKYDEKFYIIVPKYVLDSVDEGKIRSYLLQSFNEFRNDYGRKSVKESKVLTKQSQEYSVILSKPNTKWEHSNRNSRKGAAECIATVNMVEFSRVSEGNNINKIIADSFFDTFVGSRAHMEILLKKPTYEYGFGFAKAGYTFYVVIQAKKSENL